MIHSPPDLIQFDRDIILIHTSRDLIQFARDTKPERNTMTLNKRELRKEVDGYGAESVEQICEALNECERMYSQTVAMRERINHRARAFIRTAMGYNPSDDDKKRQKLIADEASRVFAMIDAGEEVDGPLARHVVPFVLECLQSSEPFAISADAYKKRLEILAEKLPVWNEHGATIKGFGLLGLARIVGIAGDFNKYDSVQKLWKRFGLAVINGSCQGRVSSKKVQDMDDHEKIDRKAAWMERGYSPKRRAVMFTIGDSLVKCSSGPFRKVYDWRKEYELKRPETKNAMHAHLKAQRYMEKQLLLELWEAWTGKEALVGFKDSKPFRVSA